MALLNDIEHLPKIVTDINGINDVLLAIDPEIIQLREDIANTLKELYVKTTNNLISRWEADFSIKYDASLSLAERRQQILNKLAIKKPLTWERLRTLIRSNIGDTVQFYIANDSANFSFTIYVDLDDTTGLAQAIKKAKPAYLVFDIVSQQFFNRYCGTFNCNMENLNTL